MLVVTPKLKKYAVENLGLKDGCTDAEVRKSVGEAILSGSLSAQELADLTKQEASESENRLRSLVGEEVGKLTKGIGDQMSSVLKALNIQTAENPVVEGETDTKAMNVGGDGAAETGKVESGAGTPAKAYAAAARAGGAGSGAGEESGVRARVKSVAEQFRNTKTAATYDKSSNPFVAKAFGGTQVHTGTGDGGRFLDMPSELDLAIAGAFLKSRMARCRNLPQPYRMTELDRKLMEYAVHECKWVGPVNFIEERDQADHWYASEKLTDYHRKAVLDDSVSGGLEAVPIEYDAALILTPLLNGELFPFTNINNVTRRRIEATAVGNPTVSWGPSEGTAISLFNTDSLISAFDNTIYPVVGAIEIGLDFLADAPADIGRTLVTNYGNRFRQEMDNVIATGDGTSQPEGLFTASGVASVSSENGASGPPTVADYEALLFGVAKEFRQEARSGGGSRALYVSNETNYSRAKGIAVGSGDQRRVFGMDHENYQILEYRYAINESFSDNLQIGFFCLNRYRMYRRQGLETRVIVDDWNLARENKQGIVMRARFGGALELGGAGAKITDAQT